MVELKRGPGLLRVDEAVRQAREEQDNQDSYVEDLVRERDAMHRQAKIFRRLSIFLIVVDVLIGTRLIYLSM